MLVLPSPPRRSPFTDHRRCRRPVRCIRVRSRDGNPLPRSSMSVISLDNADGGRSGGVIAARREDGHAHWEREGLDGVVEPFSLGIKGVYVDRGRVICWQEFCCDDDLMRG